jgi:hypothetical protein
MKTVSQKIREEHKNYFSKTSLVQTELKKNNYILTQYSGWGNSDDIFIGIDPSFEVENISYNFDWSSSNEEPSTFNYRISSDISNPDLRNVSKQKSNEIISKYFNTKELVETLIEKNQDSINGVLSEIDNLRKMNKMYEELELNTLRSFKDKIRDLMTIQNEYIELPCSPWIEPLNGNSYHTNWKVNTKWVKFRYQNETTWKRCNIEGYTIKRKVKQNYLVDLKLPNRDEPIKDVLLTPNELSSIINNTMYSLHQLEGGCLSENDLFHISKGVLDWKSPIFKITEKINEQMDIYSTFRVVFHEGDDLDHKFEVHEWNSEDQSWTFIKTYFLENTPSSHSITH